MSLHPRRMNIEGPMSVRNLDWLLLVDGQPDMAALPMAMSDARLEQLSADVRSNSHQRTSILMRHIFEARQGLRFGEPGFPGALETLALQLAFDSLVVAEQEARLHGRSCDGASDEFMALLDAACSGRRAQDNRTGRVRRPLARAWPNANVADIMATNEALRMREVLGGAGLEAD